MLACSTGNSKHVPPRARDKSKEFPISSKTRRTEMDPEPATIAIAKLSNIFQIPWIDMLHCLTSYCMKECGIHTIVLPEVA